MPLTAPNGVDLYYELHGSGEPLILVHGLTGDITDWRHQIAEFSRTHRVLVADNRGHGRSAAPSDAAAYTILQMAGDIEALAHTVGFDRFHLVGHSMGGAIAQEIALRHPSRLLSLVLEDTSFRFDGRLLQTPPRPPRLSPERLEEIASRLGRMSPDVLRAAWRALGTWEGTETRAASIAARTLVVCGEYDVPAIVEGSHRLAQLIPSCALEVIGDSAHSPQEEQPEEYNAVLRAFFERVAA